MSHNTLENYYKTNFSLMYHFKLPVDIEGLIPYERDIYVGLIQDDQAKKAEEALKQQARMQVQHARGIF